MNAAAKRPADSEAISLVNLFIRCALCGCEVGLHISRNGCKTGEARSQHDTDISNVDWHVDHL